MEIEYQYGALYMGPSGLSSYRTGCQQQHYWSQHIPSLGKRATPANNKFNYGGRL
ncbi:uncharacterized protein PgNI_00587 [Pyricularia grisea]|uniref:Uncharacterized protein n=1 Tax=Pyricularia grisea TaxID=148305 RepID=A0A6P8BG24_PYRGI